MKSSNNAMIRLIAVFKLLKAILLIAVGVGALKLLHQDAAGALDRGPRCWDLIQAASTSMARFRSWQTFLPIRSRVWEWAASFMQDCF